MLSFFKWIFVSIGKVINFSRLLILNLIFFGLIAILLVALTSDNTPDVPDGVALKLNLTGVLVEERKATDPFAEVSNKLLGQDDEKFREIPLTDVVHAIRFAKEDKRITALVLELEGLLGGGMNKLEEIAQAIETFKQSGKPVYAYGRFYSQGQYFLASHADKIMMNPEGAVLLQGLGVYRLYFKDALDKLAVTPHIFKVGTYKSFVEPYTRNDMSDTTKAANLNWLNQLWDGYKEQVALQRGISANDVFPSLAVFKQRLEAVQGDQAAYALNNGLVDELKPDLAIRSTLMDELGANARHTDYRNISFDAYIHAIPQVFSEQQNGGANVAVIFASGQILDGRQPAGAIGGDTLSQLLERARLDNSVRSVVLRLDTPGGSAFASEQIRQQVLALKEAGKTVVVSMSSTTASGGYWIAAAADQIIAAPSTLTGSIGIFGMFATFENALSKLGIRSDGVGTTALTGINVTRPLPDYMSDIIQLSIEHGYNQFIKVVAEGRGMSIEEVEKVAQGRVWTGRDAKRLGLVDEIGYFDSALGRAASLAGLDSYGVKVFRPLLSTQEQLLAQILGSGAKVLGQSPLASSPSLQKLVRSLQHEVDVLTRFNDPKGMYAYCPACLIE